MNTLGAETHADSPAWTAQRRAQIETQNQLAHAVRAIADLEGPVSRLVVTKGASK